MEANVEIRKTLVSTIQSTLKEWPGKKNQITVVITITPDILLSSAYVLEEYNSDGIRKRTLNKFCCELKRSRGEYFHDVALEIGCAGL